MTKTVTNAKELTMEVLKQLAELFSNTFEPYTYTIHPNSTVTIFNHEGMKCLEISDTEVTMRDIIQDAYNDAYTSELVKIRQNEVNSLMDIFDGLSDFGKVKVYAEPSITYISFMYFDNKEVWDIAMNNDSSDVLPFEGTEFVKTIKKLILKDLHNKWMMD